jgi:ABC-type sugar transport system ATPase subunit
MTDNTPIIRTEGLSKTFGNTHAIEDVDFSVREGEIMALVGDNGAGKSTLIKMLCGVLTPSAGRIYVRGEQVRFDSHTSARAAGIETVYQELALTEQQTVAANVFLAREPIRDDIVGRLLRLVDREHMREQARQALDQVQIPVDPEETVANLSGGQQQAVAIARALQSDPAIMIMDEPTSALSIEGVRNVLEVVQSLRNQGLTIILISHNIREVLSIADRLSVLAQGRLMGVRDVDGTTREEVISLMMGAEEDEQVETFDLTESTETDSPA